jgi:hypothetical protein
VHQLSNNEIARPTRRHALIQTQWQGFARGRLSAAEIVPLEMADLNGLALRFAQKHAHVVIIRELTD